MIKTKEFILSNEDLNTIEDYIKKYEEIYNFKDFPGNLPIKVLQQNMLYKFSFFSNEVELFNKNNDYHIDNGIKYVIGAFKTPSITYPQKGMHEIIISELFCSYMWCLSYYSLLKYESLAQQNSEIKSPECYCITEKMFNRAVLLLEWSFSPQDIEKKWDYINIPSPFPTCNLIDSEAYYCLKANDIYLHAIMACLFHEVGHAATLPKLPTNQKDEDIKESEKIADNFMFELMFKELDNKYSFSISLGIAVAYQGILLLTKPQHLINKTHPSPNLRIFYMLVLLLTLVFSLPINIFVQ